MKKYYVITLLLFSTLVLQAQIAIHGVVRDSKSHEAVVGANVMLQTKGGKGLLKFVTTDSNGGYNFHYKGSQDSLRVVISGFNLKTEYKIVPYISQVLNFDVQHQELKIREVVVKAKPIVRRGDTLNYFVSSYIDSLDSSIGDVLKKMPGIDVEKSGKILYNNMPISKFYVEGLDMMGGKYGLATNNVRAKDIASVQVLENHQPIKALKKISIPDRAAINLKLKNKAKGTFAATVLLGVGYKPWIWNGEISMMQFSSKFQMLNTYKTNNSGDDAISELGDLYDQMPDDYSMINIHAPMVPNTERERYMNNTTHALSLNTIFKLKEDLTLNVNAKYVHDNQKFEGNSRTTYYLPESVPLTIQEQTFASALTDEMELKLKLESNTEELFLKEQFTFNANWDRNDGSVINASDTIFQKFKMPKIRARNELYFVKAFKGIRLSFKSDMNYSKLPSTLKVTPILYPSIFAGDNNTNQAAFQEVSTESFNTNNTLWFNKSFNNNIDIFVTLGLKAEIEGLESNLAKFNENTGVKDNTPDSLRNDNYWQRFDVNSNIGLTYRASNKISLTLGSMFSYMNLYVKDKISEKSIRKEKLLIDPYFQLRATLTPSLKLSLNANLYNQIGAGGLGSTYGGYIMTDYRVISSRDGQIKESMMQNYNLDLSYGDAIISLFGSLNGGYWRNRSNLMYGTEYFGSLSRIEQYAIDNLSEGFFIKGKIEKRFDGISTTIGIPIEYHHTYMDVLRQGKIMKTEYYVIPVGLEISSRFSESIRGEYDIKYRRSQSKIIGGETLDPIGAFHQKLGFDFTFFKKLTMKISGEHYFNDGISSGSRSMFFVDASFIYKTKKFEYILEGRNLLNTNVYSQRLYTDITDYEYSYILRPFCLMFKVKFNIK